MKLRFRVDLTKGDRMAIAHSQGLSVASTEEDCRVVLQEQIDEYLRIIGDAYGEHLALKNHKSNQGKSNGIERSKSRAKR